MRRTSDSRADSRTGQGRRARDRLLRGEPSGSPAFAERSSHLDNLLHFVGDDIREAALSVAGVESYLVQVQEVLARAEVGHRDLEPLVTTCDLEERITELDGALASLLGSLNRLRVELVATRRAAGEQAQQAAAPATRF